MFLIFENFIQAAKYVFGFSLILMMISFVLSAIEIVISTKALFIQIADLEKEEIN